MESFGRWRNDSVGEFFYVNYNVVRGFLYGCGDVVGEVGAWNLWRRTRLRWRVNVWGVGGVRMIGCVAVPPPEPQRVWLNNPVFEHGFSSGSLVGVKHKPEQLLIISV